MMTYRVEDVRDMDAATRAKLHAAGVRSTKALVEICSTRSRRAALAQRTSIPESTLLELANMADLCRVTGMRAQYSELLEAAGVHNLHQLASRNACNFTLELAAANVVKELHVRVPSTLTVWRWIERARSSPRVIED
jgi:Domain of unknown function (DUF4332)